MRNGHRLEPSIAEIDGFEKGDDLMDGLEHGISKIHETSSFEDGMADIQELIRIMAEPIINEIMNVQA